MHSGSLRRFGGYLRTRWISPRRIRFWLLVLIVLYTLLGFFVVPRVIEQIAINTVREDVGRELHIESIHINPYTLRMRIDGLHLDDTDDRLLLGWEQASVNLSWSSLLSQGWTFHSIHLYQPVVREERLDSGETRFSRLVAEQADPETDEDGPAPALRIGELRVSDGALYFTDNLEYEAGAEDTPEPVSLALKDIRLSIENLSLEKGSRSPVDFEGQVAEGGTLTFKGSLQRFPNPALEGSAGIDELALVQAEPYLRQFLNVRVNSGALSLSGDILADPEQLFTFRGSGGIESLDIKDGSDNEALVGWQSLLTEKLHLDLSEKQVETGIIAIDGLFGKVVIHEDRTTNFTPLLADSSGHTEDNDDTGTDKDSTPFDISIERIELTDGALSFSDYSLPLFFATDIHSLTGAISTLSSTSAEPAKIELKGEIGEAGMARMEGSIHAWEPTQETRLDLTFHNLKIPDYSPYTVEFAGRKVAKGTMDLSLGYTIKERQLDGHNNLILRDVKLGEKIGSSSAMDLPLQLAMSLLEDSDGVIDLDLTVTGDVGAPEFDVGQIFRDALRDAIRSIVETPFRFLADLVGSDSEDLGQIEFTKGVAELLPPQQTRIDELREALNRRPALTLELAGPYSRSFDGPTLQHNKAIEALKAHLDEEDQNEVEPSLTTESNQAIVEAMFSEEFPDVDREEIQARFTDEDNGFDDLAYRNHLADEIIAAQSVTDQELKAVANQRASAVRDALVDADSETDIDADRVRIRDPEEIEPVDDERIIMKMGIDTDL